MPIYRVRWESDIEADTPEEAARKAQAKQQLNREGYWCGVFDVAPESDPEKWETFDLDELGSRESSDAA